MNNEEKQAVMIVGIYATFMVGIPTVWYVKARIQSSKKRKAKKTRKETTRKATWFASGVIDERMRRGDYDGVSKDDILIDFELERFRREQG